MAEDSAVAAQMVRLLQQQPPGVWELIEVREAEHDGDIVLRDTDGTPVAYARPTA